MRGSPWLAFVVCVRGFSPQWFTVCLTRLDTLPRLTRSSVFSPSLFLLRGTVPVFVFVRTNFLSAGPTVVAEFQSKNKGEGPLAINLSPERLRVLQVGLPSPFFFHVLPTLWVHSTFYVLIVQIRPHPISPSRPIHICISDVLAQW